MKFKHWYGSLQFVVLFFLVGAAHAAEGEAARYVEQCSAAISFAGSSAPNATEALNIGFCFGLMDGLRGANYFLKNADPSSAFCEPAAFDNADLAKAFVAGVETNPKLKELRGALAAQIALRATFPCKNGK